MEKDRLRNTELSSSLGVGKLMRLSDLHHDIRRLTVLAYPKLSAEAREEIACDRFTDALGDPDFALKVKERAPKSLDEALCIALRLEAWAKSVKRDRPEDDR